MALARASGTRSVLSSQSQAEPTDVVSAHWRSAGLAVGPLLGVGASSAVYAVTRVGVQAAEPAWALKLLHAEHAGNLDLVLRFLNEKQAADRVRHRGVLTVEDAGFVASRPYLVVERLHSTLAQRLPTLALPERLAVAAQLAAAAAALHEAGVVHRDLKPANVMFARGAPLTAKLVDLGLAKLSGGGGGLPVSTAASEVLGTAEYRAPELWVSAKDADGSADVYALGVMMFELLTDHLPFAAERESLLMEAHLFAPPPPLPTGGDPVVSALLLRMLAKRRAQRPHMREVAEMLRKLGYAYPQ